MKTFLKIDNRFFYKNKEKSDAIRKIKTEGFTLYCYLMYVSPDKSKVSTNMNIIRTYLNEIFKDSKFRKLKNTLQLLVKYKLISITNLDCIDKITPNTILHISFVDLASDNFTIISEQLFEDKINKIGANGWTILCLLTMLHNKTHGGEYSQGYASPSQESISEILGISTRTIRDYLENLEGYKLIEIVKQECGYYENQSNNGNLFDMVVKYTNHYIVKNKVIGTKYYISTEENNKKK